MLQRQLTLLAFALATALPMATTTAAQAQSYATAATAATARVDSFSVGQLRALTPGSELMFNLTGTPGAEIVLQIVGATGEVRMDEQRPGIYQGSYTVRSRDRLTAASLVTARVVKEGQTVNVTMDQSLVLGAASPVPVATARIAAFTVTAPEGIEPGDEITLSMTGASGGKARASVQGITKAIPMTEVSRGVYEAHYTVRRQDRLRGKLKSTGYLVVNQQESSQRFERSLSDGRNLYGSDDKPLPQACNQCGVVEAVNVVDIKSDSPNVLGTIAGGVVGGVLGHQVGGGTGKDLATIAGAVGGAYVGNRIENSRSKTKEYRVVVRLDSGTTQTFAYTTEPTLPVGAKVRIENGALLAR